MEKTIAVIGTADTKIVEINFIREFITRNGFKVLTIDVSSHGFSETLMDISPEVVANAAGYSIDEVHKIGSRSKAIEMMRLGVSTLVKQFYDNGDIHAVLGLGGLQNTLLSSSAMQRLPVGIPKVILSTIACGSRTFGKFVGTKDVMLLPSIGDVVGINPLTKIGLENAAAAVMGMVQYAGEPLKPEGFLIGATIMGATSDGILDAINHLKKVGYNVITFHSTGVGGLAMEDLIDSGVINAVLDLSLHEIVAQDVFGGGFSVGATDRLSAAVRQGIPMVLAPGGLDFIDYSIKEFKDGVIGDPEKRKYTLHNKDIAHIKLLPEEAELAANVIVERLSDVKENAVMVLPLQGLRAETRPGDRMHDPEVDQAIFQVLRNTLNKKVKLIELDAHISDPVFSQCVANSLIELLN